MESDAIRFIHSLTPEEYGFTLAALLLAAFTGFYCFTRAWKRWHLIQDTPTARLRSAHQGYIELEGRGRALPDRPIFAPLSNHECLWYHSLIECKETLLEQKRTRTEWKVLYQNTSSHAFLLDDGTGTCVVDPEAAEIISNEKIIWHGNTEWPTRTGVLDNDSAIVALASRYRYTERLILPGQRLYLIGHLQTRSPATEKSVHDITRDLLSDWKLDREQLLERFDSNQDGEIDQAEWEVARREAFAQAQTTHQQLQQATEVNYLSMPEDKERPFIISVHPQTELIRNYRRTALIALAACFGVAGCIVWLLHVHG
ncbi:GIDE domain-containing protein [Nitrosomonas sp.]|uniref:GIDE domain-containing protein n=1 Tax=Nitrosomonas sp. TaxID=42353 RepID=UPI0025D3DD38|nr:GIDE domain-containing protein [Nitrosomonas sp.]MCC6915981.1 E3 ubiquitin--protein ligase [Nitrosomonas sp.]